MTDWHVYIVRTRLDTLYTGIATDVARRLEEHQGGGGKGARYLRAKGPLELVYAARIGCRELASRVEHRIKRLSRQHKDHIVESKLSAINLLEYLGIE